MSSSRHRPGCSTLNVPPLNQNITKPMTYSPGVQMDNIHQVTEDQQGGGGEEGGEVRRGGSSKREREEEEDLGPVRGQERRDPLSRRQGRGVGK